MPEVINMASGNMGQPSSKVSTSDVSVIAQNMRTFRILRSLKMVSRFQKVRLIVLAVTKAFQVGQPSRFVTSYVPVSRLDFPGRYKLSD